MAKKTTKRPKRQRSIPSDEQRVDLMLWHKDGMAVMCYGIPGNGKALPEVSVGRTDSERGLGFEVTMHPDAEFWLPPRLPCSCWTADRSRGCTRTWRCSSRESSTTRSRPAESSWCYHFKQN